MYSYDKVMNGIAKYIDNEIVDKMRLLGYELMKEKLFLWQSDTKEAYGRV